MATVVGVRFKKAGKIYYFDPGDLDLVENDLVIVETARGMEAGTVVIGRKEVPEEEISQPLKAVLRKATSEDEQQIRENKQKAKEAFGIGLKKIAEHQLPMKLIDVEYTFDNSKIIFYFTAEGRVDFRELVKDLAAIFRTRIELHQIGVRDEAKMIGGLGPCGRAMCCTTFLGDFEPVSIKMAKEQNLSLNPAKISGICGRLMCCLKFERDLYRETPKGEEDAEQECSCPCSQECTEEIVEDTGEGVVEMESEVEVPEEAEVEVEQEETAPAEEETAKAQKPSKQGKKKRRPKYRKKKKKRPKEKGNGNGNQGQ
ncbi:MAG TPA: stage 0 sporulation family protein [Firmicutes bacterium]|jgi:cell fate regulator YaaT (PSP1 superfamily)|nr:stage 0 sporulation family protein [Bacillota bacterium]